jgi:hypothetical protein
MIGTNKMFGSSMMDLKDKKLSILTPVSHDNRGQSLIEDVENEIKIEHDKEEKVIEEQKDI